MHGRAFFVIAFHFDRLNASDPGRQSIPLN
jgi:hypothetical protein